MTLPKSKRRDQSIAPITISVAQAISLSDLSEATIYDLLKKGRLRGSKIGRRHLIDYASLRELLLQPQPEESRRRGRPRKQPAPQSDEVSER